MTHYRGDLLDGFDARSTAFDEWLTSERMTLRKEMSDALQQLADCASRTATAKARSLLATKLVSLEPLNEAAHRMVMELHAKRNAYAEALRQYRVCRDVLRRELDVAPEPATEQLYRDLMRRRRAALGTRRWRRRFARRHCRARIPRVAEPAAPVELRPQLLDATILVARLEGLLEPEAQLDPEEAHMRWRRNSIVACMRRSRSSAAAPIAASAAMCSPCSAFRLRTATSRSAQRRPHWLLQSMVASTPWPVASALALRIGIAQGQVLCGSELFPLTGRPTHEAHTLAAQAADGEILISEELRAVAGRTRQRRACRERRSPHADPVMRGACRDCAPRSARARSHSSAGVRSSR